MTAIAAVLNKQAIAVAADSAVTVSGERRKVMNTALKIFTLSKFHPVGVMVYNHAAFMGTPWEMIIKAFRKELKDTSFETVKQYAERFLKYLETQSYFSTAQSQKMAWLSAFTMLLNDAQQELSRNNPGGQIPAATFIAGLKEMMRKRIAYSEKSPEGKAFKGYTIEEFEKEMGDDIWKVLLPKNEPNLDAELRSLIIKCLYLYTTRELPDGPSSGIVFIGFGEAEFFPRVLALNISFAVGNRLRYRWVTEKSTSIDHDTMTASIQLFAQDDVASAILGGVDPRFERYATESFAACMERTRNVIAQRVSQENPALGAAVSRLDLRNTVEEFRRLNGLAKHKHYINPLMESVASLSKEDMAEMAESLVHITYLKRRITNAEESVGGPVDVAVVTKGDGFIWIKRKHYFSRELNEHFFTNYMRTS